MESTFLPREFYTNSSSCLKLSCPNLCRCSPFLSPWSEVISVLQKGLLPSNLWWKTSNLDIFWNHPLTYFPLKHLEPTTPIFPFTTISLSFSPNKRMPIRVMSVLINDEHSIPRNTVWHWVGIQWERKGKQEGDEKGTYTFINETEKSLHQRNYYLPNTPLFSPISSYKNVS